MSLSSKLSTTTHDYSDKDISIRNLKKIIFKNLKYVLVSVLKRIYLPKKKCEFLLEKKCQVTDVFISFVICSSHWKMDDASIVALQVELVDEIHSIISQT